MVEKIYINTNSGSISSARVESATDPTPKSFASIVVGDVRIFDIFLTDGNGNLETTSEVKSLSLSIGKPGQLLSSTTNFLPSSGGFRMTIPLNNQSTFDALNGTPTLQTFFEVTRTNYEGEKRTILQAEVTLSGEVSDVTTSTDQIFQECFILAITDEVTNIPQGSGLLKFRLPFSFELLEARASVNSAPVGSSIIIDLNSNGSSVLGQKIEIPGGEKSSQEAQVLATISTQSLADNSEISIDVDQVGSSSPGTALKVYLSGRRG